MKTRRSDSDPLQILSMKNIVSPQTANCGESSSSKEMSELQPRVFTKRLIVSGVSPPAQWRIILPQDILFYSKLWGFPGKLTLTPSSCEATLPASHWPKALILSSHWLRYHRMRRWVNIWEELRMWGSVWRQFEGVFVFLALQIWKCDGGIRLVTVRILTWRDPIVQKTDISGMLMHFWAAQTVMISPKIHQHLPATHNDSGLKWSHWTWTWTPDVWGITTFSHFGPVSPHQVSQK